LEDRYVEKVRNRYYEDNLDKKATEKDRRLAYGGLTIAEWDRADVMTGRKVQNLKVSIEENK
jgi:hypothetical protein